jgi:hypothetical protein
MDQPLKDPIVLQPRESKAPSLRDHVSNPRQKDSRPRLESKTEGFKTKDSKPRPIGSRPLGFETSEFETLEFGIENSNSNIISNDN